jgi:serine/threonine-protein kinase
VSILPQLQDALGDRYEFERELGGGGMSLVFLATERALARRVVIKVLHPELSQSVNAERFRQEIATLATLQHPQIVPILSAGNAGALLYYVMPFVAGESLRARLEREGAMSATDVVRLVAPLARALAYAHREGIVHRDIKPENVLLAQGEPVLADFGIAKVLREGSAHGTLTSAGMSIGTVTYMAPEQVLAEPTMDGRADVYSLAAMAWELMAGRAPFGGTAQQVMSAHVVKPAPALADVVPDVSPALAAVVQRGLAKDPNERDTADVFASALESALLAPRAATAATVTPAARASTAAPAPRRAVSIPLLTAAALLLLVAGAWWWRTQPAATGAESPVAADTPVQRPGVAVLPFERIGASGDDYVSAGLADELMTQLADVSGLRVAAKTSVRAFIDSALTPTELGRRLDVRALVEGSVQQSGTRLRVTTRLVDVRDGGTIWSNRYERSTDDLFAVQREIGAEIVAALAPRLGIVTDGTPQAPGNVNPAAFDAYLRGRFAMQQRGLDSLRAAVAHFRRAITIDSTFARAWAGVAEASALLPVYGGGGWDVHGPALRDAAERALRLDSLLGAPHLALATLAKGVGEWATAEREFDLALARQPDLGATHQNRGELLYTIGRVNDAVTAFARAAALEPQDAPIISQFAGTLVIAGQLDSARRVLDRALVLDPQLAFAYWSEMMLAERQGNARASLAAAQRASSLAPLPFFAGLAVRAARRAGDSAALTTTQAALDALGDAPGVALARALAQIDVADGDRTLELLERAVAERDPLMWQVPLRLWWFDPVRTTPRFRALATQLRLPPQVLEALPAPR